MTINEKLSTIQTKFKSKKSRFNSFGKYYFRSAEDIQMPQRFGAASSYGKKYALGNLFLIDDTKDSDATNTHGKNDITGRQLAQAKDYVKSGGKIEAIKKKYQLTSAQEAELKTL